MNCPTFSQNPRTREKATTTTIYLVAFFVIAVCIVCSYISTFSNCIVPMGFLPWEKRVAFPGES